VQNLSYTDKKKNRPTVGTGADRWQIKKKTVITFYGERVTHCNKYIKYTSRTLFQRTKSPSTFSFYLFPPVEIMTRKQEKERRKKNRKKEKTQSVLLVYW
jgi:hypothetical protein